MIFSSFLSSHAGVSRSAAVVVAYLMEKHGKNVRKALAT
jgi:protein-tyrosine phosphatase